METLQGPAHLRLLGERGELADVASNVTPIESGTA